MIMIFRNCRHHYLLLLTSCTLLVSCTQPVQKFPLLKPLQSAESAEPSPLKAQYLLAKNQLSAGEYGKSGRTFEEIISSPTEAGITDEALFQLALLNMRGNNREGTNKSSQLLQRLIKEYPRSSWAYLAQPLLEQLESLAEQRRQLNAAKNQQQTLSKEIKELHQTIDRLKTLDLEMEKRSLR